MQWTNDPSIVAAHGIVTLGHPRPSVEVAVPVSGGSPEPEEAAPEQRVPERHRAVQGGAARAAVFGVSDGLVTNVSLIVGMAGAHPAAGVVRLAGLAGLAAGACSMAIGEYVSMRAQRELLEREIDKERREIQQFPEAERRELAGIYQSRGLDHDLAHRLASAMMRDEELAVETHAREELGIDRSSLGSAVSAAVSSFATFALGAAVPLVPWLVTRGAAAVIATVVAAGLLAIVVGGALGIFTGRSPIRSAFRQLALSAVAAAIAFGVGSAARGAGIR